MQDRKLYHNEQAVVEYPVRDASGFTAWFEMVIRIGGEMADISREYTEISKVFKALSHPARLKLLKNLMKRECCVGEIQKCLALSQPNVSQHLGILKEAGIIVGKREKNKICYSISDNRIKKILKIFETGEK